MARRIMTGNPDCLCSSVISKKKIVYILYPMDMLADFIEPAAEKYGVTVAVLTGMDWQNVFSPWPAKGVPAGDPDFKGESPQFLAFLRQKVIPRIEAELQIESDAERSLIGVSMSGLFALWQWMECDTFANIASLSGSFWYEGFVDWMKSLAIPAKKGKAYFLLGTQESKSKVKAFDSVGENTAAIVEMLRQAGIDAEFQSVPGNHYSDPLPRLGKAFEALFAFRSPNGKTTGLK